MRIDEGKKVCIIFDSTMNVSQQLNRVRTITKT